MKYAKWMICFGLGLAAAAPAMNAAEFRRGERIEVVRRDRVVRCERPVIRYERPICR
jgi:hypothetical protein